MECRIREAGYVEGQESHLRTFLSNQPEVIASTIAMTQDNETRVTTFEVNVTHRDDLERLAAALRRKFGVALQAKVPPEQRDPCENLQAANVFG